MNIQAAAANFAEGNDNGTALTRHSSAVKIDGGQYLKASAVVRMIILLSKTDQIVRHKKWWYFVFVLSLIHAAVPLLHSRLYKPLYNGYFAMEWDHTNDNEVVLVFAVIAFGSLMVGGFVKRGYISTSLGTVGLIAAIVAVVCDLVLGDQNWGERIKVNSTLADLSLFPKTTQTKIEHAAIIEHLARVLSFLVNYTLTFSITIRLAKCYEDYYEKYQRMKYLLHL